MGYYVITENPVSLPSRKPIKLEGAKFVKAIRYVVEYSLNADFCITCPEEERRTPCEGWLFIGVFDTEEEALAAASKFIDNK